VSNQLTRGEKRRVMYVENKDGDVDGVSARIGWVTFSKSRGSNVHWAEPTKVVVDDDAREEYQRLRKKA
jgi:hypothetical protein